MKIFLDDCRPMPIEFDTYVQTAQDCINLLNTGKVTHISLDHDLGDENIVGSGYIVATYIEEAAFYNKIPKLSWQIHSANGVGRQNMEMALKNADRFWNL